MNHNALLYRLAIILPLAVLLLHSFYYYPFVADDAFISLRYAERLLEGRGLTWNDGERVEGYSNLLWVLLNAGLAYVGFEWLAAPRALGLVCSGLTLWAIHHYYRRFLPDKPGLPLFGGLMLACSGPVAIWSVGGLEGTLMMAFMAWAYVLASELLETSGRRHALLLGLLLGGVCLTRPEGPFFTMAIAAALFIAVRYPRRRLWPCMIILCGVPFLFFAAQLGFRLAYYGEYLPNTYYAKVPYGTERFLDGLSYLASALMTFLPVLLIPLLYLDKLPQSPPPQKSRLYLLGLVCLLWLMTIPFSGGDIFPGYRHMLPILPALVMIVMECILLTPAQSAAREIFFYGGVLAGFFWVQLTCDENMAGKTERWGSQARDIGLALGKKYGNAQPKPLIAVGAAGAIPFYSKLPALDVFGLNDHYLAHHWTHTEYRGRGFLAHELFNAEYIKRRKPDILIFKLRNVPDICAPTFNDCGDLLDAYRPQTLELPDSTVTIWLRK